MITKAYRSKCWAALAILAACVDSGVEPQQAGGGGGGANEAPIDV